LGIIVFAAKKLHDIRKQKRANAAEGGDSTDEEHS